MRDCYPFSNKMCSKSWKIYKDTTLSLNIISKANIIDNNPTCFVVFSKDCKEITIKEIKSSQRFKYISSHTVVNIIVNKY